jgi:hypothetical protein
LSAQSISIIVTDGGEINSASKIGDDNILWVWCCIHLLSLVFQDSFNVFPQNNKEKKANWLVMLRKVVNILLTNFDKISDFLLVPKGHFKVYFCLQIKRIEKEIQREL